MRERSEFREEAVVSALRAHYAIEATSLEPLPGGEDPSARVFRVGTAAGLRYLVKLRDAAGSRSVAAAVSGHLSDSGLRHVVAPIRSAGGSHAVEAGSLAVSVYPLVDGRTGVEAGLLERHWVELGREIRRLHETVLPTELSDLMPRETYRPAELGLVRRVDRAVADGRGADDAVGEAAPSGPAAARRSSPSPTERRTSGRGSSGSSCRPSSATPTSTPGTC